MWPMGSWGSKQRVPVTCVALTARHGAFPPGGRERGLVHLSTQLVQSCTGPGNKEIFLKVTCRVKSWARTAWESLNLHAAHTLVTIISKYKLEIYHSPLMKMDKNLQPWKHQWNEISLSDTDPVSTSVQNPQSPCHGFWQEPLPWKLSTDLNHRKVLLGMQEGNSGRDTMIIFLPIFLKVSQCSKYA